MADAHTGLLGPPRRRQNRYANDQIDPERVLFSSLVIPGEDRSLACGPGEGDPGRVTRMVAKVREEGFADSCASSRPGSRGTVVLLGRG
jgi:hypothetical protein